MVNDYIRTKQTNNGWDVFIVSSNKERKLASFATMKEADEYARRLMSEPKEKTYHAIPNNGGNS